MAKSNDRLYRKTPTGSWYGWYYDSDGRLRYVCLKTKDRKTARIKLTEIERSSASRSVSGRSDPYMLLSAFDAFLAEGCADLSPSTVKMYSQKGRHLLRLLGADLDIGVVTRDDVQRFITTRRQEGAHQGTIFKEIVALRRCLTHAFEHDKLKTDPRSLIPKIKNKYQPRRQYLTEDQFERLVVELRPHRAWWVTMAVFTGARRSELERIVVEEHVDLRNGWLTIPGTKTAGSDRIIPISAHLRRLLRSRAPKKGPLVEPWGAVNRDLTRACGRAGVPQVSPNDLRRTFASWLKQAGEDSFVVAKLLGHTTSLMVERVYGHLGNENFRRAVERLPEVGATKEPGTVHCLHPPASR